MYNYKAEKYIIDNIKDKYKKLNNFTNILTYINKI